jgi:hypothetical protein
MQSPIPICNTCKHFKKESWTCDAFRDGIPVEIISGESDHSKPLPGQGNQIVYEAKEETE